MSLLPNIIAPNTPMDANKVQENFEALDGGVSNLSTTVDSVESSIASKLSTLKVNIDSEIDKVKTDLEKEITTTNSKITTLDSRKFTYKNLTIGVGTTSLSSYLPNDGKEYFVWLSAIMHGTSSGGSYYATVRTDKLSATGFIQLDGDSGRAQRTRALTCVPVGSGRTITIAVGDTPDDQGYYLRGYCRI